MNNRRRGSKQHRYESLKNFSIAKVSVPDNDQGILHNDKSYNQIHCPPRNKGQASDDDHASINDGSKGQKQKPMISLTEDERLQLQFVLTAQNCADCGLW